MGELFDTTQYEENKIEINEDFELALNYLENTNRSMFITGKAGSGKSTLINYFRKHTKKNYVVLAPTGIAAVNIHGQTIHSFFKFPFGILDKQEIADLMYRNSVEGLSDLDMIIVDEISMVRCDLLDAMESVCKAGGKDHSQPFGGIQMVFLGDLFQLPPVVTGNDLEYFSTLYPNPFFFSANVFKQLQLVSIELRKIYRQKGDVKFLELLESVRNNSVSKNDLDELNKRHKVVYPGEEEVEEDFVITLTTTNEKAKTINENRLNEINTTPFRVFATISFNFPKESFPTEEELVLKPEAQILMLKNDPQGRWCNGTLGKVIGIIDEGSEKKIEVQLKNNDGEIQTYKVGKETWQNIKYVYDKASKQMKKKVVGEFRQYPMKLAFAITGHKSQGQTYDSVKLHFGKGCFASGQAYVMLSRCRTLDGITLLTEIRRRDIFTDKNILEFIERLRKT